jgi:galacturonokinase
MNTLPTFSAQTDGAIDFLRKHESVVADDIGTVISPYRICPLGAHIDHQGGPVLGRTICTGTVLAFAPLQIPEIRLHSEYFGHISFPIGQPPDMQHWARYAQAAAVALSKNHPLKRGFAGFVSGTLIGAGLSSSASVILAYLRALAQVNELSLSQEELVTLEFQAEHDILGLQIGILDPATIANGLKDALLHIDTVNGTVTPIRDAARAQDWVWLVAFSGVFRQLLQSGYNNRVAECREAALLLQAGASRLCEVPSERFLEYQYYLPEHLRRRARHFYGEVDRVREGGQAWAKSDAVTFGKLMKQSCHSSIRLYESGSPVLVDLHNIVSAAPGVFGSRFSGGGYGGCVVGLADRASAGEAVQVIHEKFAAMHSELARQSAVYVVETSDGLHISPHPSRDGQGKGEE